MHIFFITTCITCYLTRAMPKQSELNAQKRLVKSKDKMEPPGRLPKRDLATKYFGQHLEGEFFNLKINQ